MIFPFHQAFPSASPPGSSCSGAPCRSEPGGRQKKTHFPADLTGKIDQSLIFKAIPH